MSLKKYRDERNKALVMLRLFNVLIEKLQKSISVLAPREPVQLKELEAAAVVPDDVTEGHFAVFAIKGEETKRFVVELDYLTNPAFLRLLEKAKEEYGFSQKGALSVPCLPEELQKIIDDKMEKSTGAGLCLNQYKLGTDIQILLEKVDMALKKYKMHMVVANELLTCKDEVVVVTSNEKMSVFRYKTQVGDVVENPLIRLIVERHLAYVEKSDL
ncbi:hypothetical protein SO802_030512 [Lithocarpus litseifolius]|uniref:Uncharacterized protein n=1 Tax=Lithocarpus litseifolius TaxID=425828 RepID=A0AAW2BHP2_9ROSI